MIQRNALKSWTLLHPDVEVILFGEDQGAAQVSAELGLRHEPHVERHESGMKVLSYIFERAQKIARHNLLCYSNCDMIFGQELARAVSLAADWRPQFLLIGSRWDTDVREPIDFTNAQWEQRLRELALRSNGQQGPTFIDYFAFRKGTFDHVPPLLIGRDFWDHWLVWNALSAGAAVLDATRFVVAVHQNHDYAYHPAGKQGAHADSLALRNIELAGGRAHLRTLIHCTHRITKDGRIRRTPFRRLLQNDSVQNLRHAIMEKTFGIRHRLGLHRAAPPKLSK